MNAIPTTRRLGSGAQSESFPSLWGTRWRVSGDDSSPLKMHRMADWKGRLEEKRGNRSRHVLKQRVIRILSLIYPIHVPLMALPKGIDRLRHPIAIPGQAPAHVGAPASLIAPRVIAFLRCPSP